MTHWGVDQVAVHARRNELLIKHCFVREARTYLLARYRTPIVLWFIPVRLLRIMLFFFFFHVISFLFFSLTFIVFVLFIFNFQLLVFFFILQAFLSILLPPLFLFLGAAALPQEFYKSAGCFKRHVLLEG
jgi:hypothetical protein